MTLYRNGSPDRNTLDFVANKGCPWQAVPRDIKENIFADTWLANWRSLPIVHYRPSSVVKGEPDASIPRGGRMVYTFLTKMDKFLTFSEFFDYSGLYETFVHSLYFLEMVYTLVRIQPPPNPHTDLSYSPDTKTRPPPIAGWSVEPEIFTHRRRKTVGRRPYLVRHPKMEFKDPNTGPGVSIGNRSGGGDARDNTKVMVVVESHVDTPRPENQFYSDSELRNVQKKEMFFKEKLI